MRTKQALVVIWVVTGLAGTCWGQGYNTGSYRAPAFGGTVPAANPAVWNHAAQPSYDRYMPSSFAARTPATAWRPVTAAPTVAPVAAYAPVTANMPYAPVNNPYAANGNYVVPVAFPESRFAAPCGLQPVPAVAVPVPGYNGTSFGAGRAADVAPTLNLGRGQYIGENVFGKPKLYFEGQPVRNFIRSLTL
ncbi:MAG: hypothetical protein R3E01_18980 [Pirellulaceae bacterium]|nr:hypothetical protein [Planctomycetales bacterium]